VFDQASFSYLSARRGEDRWVTIGIAHERLVAVVWTDRSGTFRVISMRRARREETRQYRQLYD
jgi:uncharacterized DUF497 family protein